MTDRFVQSDSPVLKLQVSGRVTQPLILRSWLVWLVTEGMLVIQTAVCSSTAATIANNLATQSDTPPPLLRAHVQIS